jgi:hypothetical protein
MCFLDPTDEMLIAQLARHIASRHDEKINRRMFANMMVRIDSESTAGSHRRRRLSDRENAEQSISAGSGANPRRRREHLERSREVEYLDFIEQENPDRQHASVRLTPQLSGGVV